MTRSLIKGIDAIVAWDAEPVRAADIGIEGGKIAFVAASPGDAPQGFSPDATYDGSGRLAIPALANAHCHSAMTLFRGYADDTTLEDWLFNRILPAEGRLTEDDVYWGTSLAAAEMIRGGVGAVHDMYLKMDAASQAYADSGMRARVSFGPLVSSGRGGARVDADACKRFFKRWDGACQGRIRADVEIHSVYLYDPDALREGAALAKELSAPVHIHILETLTEKREMTAKRGASSVELASRYGLLDGAAVAAHCVHVDDSEIMELARRGVHIAHCPASNLKLASGVAPVPRMLDAGARVCLGTDGAASNNTLGLIEEMRLAALVHKGVGLSPVAVAASEAFRMATRAGAEALGFPECGMLLPGMSADIAIIDLDKPHLTPVHSLLSTLVYSARSSDVETLFVQGEPLLLNGRLTRIDEERAIAEARRAASKHGARA